MKILKSIGIGFIAALCAGCGRQDCEILLHNGWNVMPSAYAELSGEEISSPGIDLTGWYEATVPSTVMGVLTENGVYSDSMEGMNYKNIDKTIFDSPWWYRTEFSLAPLKDGEHARVVFDGISYRANVWLNGHKIADADELYGTFRRHAIDITDYISRDNVLAVEVFKARPGEPNIGFVDWNPRPADESMGIFREVRILKTGPVSMSDAAVRSKVNTETLDEAWLTVEARVDNLSGNPVQGTLVAEYEGGTIEIPVSLEPGESKTVSAGADEYQALYVKNPRLWWSRNLGSPQMYQMDLKFVVDGRESDSRHLDFGIRQIEDYFTEEGYRGFILNGKKVLVRSAGWTDDIFLRDTPESNETQIRYVCDMNLNSIRCENIWGTSQNLYDLCDRYGIMVLAGWSCHWEWEHYIGSPCDEFGGIMKNEDMDLIAQSLKDQILWLRNHPSIIGWFVGSDMLPRPELEKRYLAFLPSIDDRPYLSSAKEMTSTVTGPSGMKMAGPYEYVSPLYWYDTENAPGGAFGFNTETCIGAQLPVIESIREMIPEDKLWPLNEYWNYHCTAATEDMNSMDELVSIISARLGEPQDLDDFLRKADWLNYEGTRAMFEAFRANIPTATGIVQWMLNSAWPSLYWQLYDWYLRPTAAYYGVKDGNADRQLIYNYASKKVVAVNEGMDPVKLSCRMTLYSIDGKTISQETASVDAEPYAVEDVFNVTVPEGNSFLMLEILDEDGTAISDNYYCLASEDDVYDWKNSSWYQSPIIRHADFKALQTMPEADVDVTAVRNGNTVRISLENTSDAFAFFIRLSFKDKDGKLVSPVFFDDNYVSVPAGKTRTVECTLPESEKEVSLVCYGWNVDETEMNL